jgi:hypothetical protein
MTPAAVDEIMKEVQRVSGLPAIVRLDPTLKVLSTIRMARRGQQAHIISYRNAAAPERDYLVAFQCGCILRHFGVVPCERADFVFAKAGRSAIGKQFDASMDKRMKAALGSQELSRLADQVYDGLMLQLRSIPLALRVDAWIADRYPVLAEQQKIAINRQLQENAGVLQGDIRKMIPPAVYRASVGINAAFAEFWASRFGQPLLVLPYKSAGFHALGQTLLGRLEAVADQPAEDRKVIDAWAAELGITGWYEWVPMKEEQ